MRLEELWQKSTLITLEEAFHICDAVRESVDRPSLSQAVIAAAKILAGTKWALCGGFVVGVLTEPRATIDVDILVADRSTVLTKLLQSHQFSVEKDRLKHLSGGVIDILDINSRYWNMPKQVALQALKTAVLQRAFGQQMPMVTPAGLIATKLGRAITNLQGADQDQVDILNVLRKYGYQDLSNYNITATMEREYKRLVAKAKTIQDQPVSDDGIVGH